MRLTIILFFLAFFLSACETDTSKNDKLPLPILGEKEVVDGETVYHTIPEFEFIDQDSNIITNASFEDKVYIVDYFFTHCPTICPKVKQQMIRIYDKYKDDDRVALISHTIDTPRDSVPRLKVYANRLEVSADKWHFVTGDPKKISSMAKEYFITAIKDPDAPGGYDHSGNLVLVDKNRMVRSFCNGLKPEEVDRMILDIQKLLDEG